MSSKRASLSSPPRARTVAVCRWTRPDWTSVQRDIFLSEAAAHRRAERIRDVGGEAVIYTATIGDWSEA